MRLIKMKIENFLSIVKADIDFTKFKEGVFIISGPTGSGKSSVFDAIHFAFYGTPSNHNRNSVRKTLFSTYAGAKDWLNVEIIFEQSGQTYKILRSMNNAGNTGAKLWMPNGDILTKLKEVDTAISDIIKLNGHQFDQMVMLEQNNFSKFLLADSSERGSLLRSVFDTQVFQFIQDYFKGKCSDIKKQLDDIMTAERLIQCGRTKEQMITEYSAGNATIETLRSRKEQLMKQLADCQAQLPARLEYETAYAQYQIAVQELSRLKTQEEKILHLKELRELNSRLKLAGQLYSQYVSLDNYLKEVSSQIDIVDSEISRLPQVAATSNVSAITQYTLEKSSLIAAIRDIQELESIQNKLQYSRAELDQLKANVPDVEVLKTHRDLVETQLHKREVYESELASYKQLQLNADEQRSYLIGARKELETIESGLYDTAVSFLITHSDETCPVCGKPYDEAHPKNLTEHTDADWSQYGRIQSSIEKAEHIIKQAETASPVPDCGVASTCEELRGSLWTADYDYNQGILEKERIEVKIEMLKSTIKQLEADAEILSAKCSPTPLIELQSRLSEIDRLIAESQAEEEERVRIESQRNELTGKLKELHNRQSSLTEEIGFIKNQPQWSSIDEYLENESQLALWSRNEATFLTQISEYDSQISLYESVTCPTTTIEKTGAELKLIIQGMSSELTEVAGKVAGFEEKQKHLSESIERLNQYAQQREELHVSLKEYEYMAKQTSGDNASKVSLENFVLHRQLEWILQNSNKFLAQLSNNQYQLQLSWESIGRRQGGLELSVLDVTNGTVRLSQTFSGGELFLLSLSLSIGLMVSINAVFSTVSLEMLFIDEGFGTLDNNTLNRVLALIHNLQSVHSIGIISHVQDLIETIPQGLRVEKTLTGTKIKQF